MLLNGGERINTKNNKQKILVEKTAISRQDMPWFLVLRRSSQVLLQYARAIYLWSFRSWVYSSINSFTHLEGTTPEGKLGRDKAGYNLSTPTLRTKENAEGFSHPRYLIAKRTNWIKPKLALCRLKGKRV